MKSSIAWGGSVWRVTLLLGTTLSHAYKPALNDVSHLQFQPILPWVLPKNMGRGVRPPSQTLTLLMTKICDFPYPIYALFMT